MSSAATTPHLRTQTTTPTQQTTTQPPPPTTTITHPSLPPPQTFDILPPLHALLLRLEPSLNPNLPPFTSPTDLPPDTTSAALSYKDVSTASQFLKSRIRKAIGETGKLADMDRTVGEQGEEIRELEERIRRQREVLVRLGGLAGECAGRMKG